MHQHLLRALQRGCRRCLVLTRALRRQFPHHERHRAEHFLRRQLRKHRQHARGRFSRPPSGGGATATSVKGLRVVAVVEKRPERLRIPADFLREALTCAWQVLGRVGFQHSQRELKHARLAVPHRIVVAAAVVVVGAAAARWLSVVYFLEHEKQVVDEREQRLGGGTHLQALHRSCHRLQHRGQLRRRAVTSFGRRRCPRSQCRREVFGVELLKAPERAPQQL
mmetsp:Transcript_46334/g.91567  ORF Transcript_46334/g.91567 Transcript_46334/m.91567 type:complete len:223 (+) Transcript_46334:398-1066(+)